MRRRYRRQAYRSGALSPLAIAGICVAAVILLTVVVGNLLTLWLDDETYARLTGGEPEEPPVVVEPSFDGFFTPPTFQTLTPTPTFWGVIPHRHRIFRRLRFPSTVRTER